MHLRNGLVIKIFDTQLPGQSLFVFHQLPLVAADHSINRLLIAKIDFSRDPA